MNDLAVVVLNYNGKHLLPACLASLVALTRPAEVVVADNGSTDSSLDDVRRNYPAVRTVDLGRNLGFAAGYNAALKCTEATWLALVNNDARLEPNWAATLLDWAADHPRAALLGGKLLFEPKKPGDEPVLQSAGASFTDAGTA